MFVAVPVVGSLWPLAAANAFRVASMYGGQFSIKPDMPWIDQARAELLGAFRTTTETEILFIDSDIWFDAEIVAIMRAAKADVITCTYRKRHAPFPFVAAAVNGHPKRSPTRMVDGKRVIEIERDGLGCCLIQRRVINALCVPELEYVSNEDGKARWNLFEYGITVEEDGKRRAGQEDRAFFKRVREGGFKVECLLDATITHAGIPGRFADVLEEK